MVEDPKNTSDLFDAYLSEFSAGESANYSTHSRLAKAYEVALDIRKFEIELSWKRAGYFWLMLAAFAAALGLIATSASLDTHERLRDSMGLFVSLAGVVVAICWSVVNRASKTWQRNWEYQVDVLEDAVLGPLYKTVMFKDGRGNGQMERHHSVSEVSIWVAYYFSGLFAVCALYFSALFRAPCFDPLKCAIILVNGGFLLLMFWRTIRIAKTDDLHVRISMSRRTLGSGTRVEPPNPQPTHEASSSTSDSPNF